MGSENSTMSCGTLPEFSISLTVPDSCYDCPVAKKKEDNKLYLRYNAIGIPPEDLVVKEEFVNSSGEMFLNCDVKYKHKFWEDERRVKIHYKVNTEVYESWDSFVEDGYLIIVLNERLCERPDFHRVAVWNRLPSKTGIL